MDEFTAGGEQIGAEFLKVWKSKEKRAIYLKWAKTVYKDAEVQFLIDVEDYTARPTWKKLDEIVDKYLAGPIIDVTGAMAQQALTLRTSTNRNDDPPDDVFDEGFEWIIKSLKLEHDKFTAWESMQ
jgi:hypothetical protein